MPYETYYNLPKDKQIRIIDAAINEFAEVGYDKATISNIILEAQIPKGSYYQYFKDKKDLFLYLATEVMAQKKMIYMTPILENLEKHDFFTLLSDLFEVGVLFATQNPKLEKIGIWFLKNQNHDIFKELLSQTEPMAANIYGSLLQRAMDKGEIRDDIDVAYISHLIPTIMTSTMEYSMKPWKDDELVTYSDEKMNDAMKLIVETLKLMLGKKA
jgi:AcrR family transcriptional regulator